MFVILHGNNIFCGYNPSGYTPNGYLIWEKFSFENTSVRPLIFLSEIDAVAEGNHIQKEYHVGILVVPIERWIDDNKK